MSSIRCCTLTLLCLCCSIVLSILYFGFILGVSTDIHSLQTVSRNSWITNYEIRPKIKHSAAKDFDSQYSNQDALKEIGEIVRRRLHYIQNPESCKARRKFHCRVHDCGLGCKVNTISLCLMLAYVLNRTVVVTPPLTNRLEPLSSTCLDLEGGNSTRFEKDYEQHQIVSFYHMENWYRPEFYPPAVPADLFDRIRRYHDDPFLWWIGQISRYVFQLTDVTYQKLVQNEYMDAFEKPIVGVHVRRTDKLLDEAALHTVDEYMVHVERWFKKRTIRQPRIFLATDEPNVLEEIAKRYPHIYVVSNINFTIVAKNDRKSETGIFGIIHDIYLLSKCDYLVCTFSSNVCRLSYQLMNAEKGNVSRNTVSLDHPWLFWGAGIATGNGLDRRVNMPIYSDDL